LGLACAPMIGAARLAQLLSHTRDAGHLRPSPCFLASYFYSPKYSVNLSIIRLPNHCLNSILRWYAINQPLPRIFGANSAHGLDRAESVL
jgi:hypothetical protein